MLCKGKSLICSYNVFMLFIEQAVLLAPYNTEDQQQFLTESLEILKQFPSKHKVAKSLYAAEIAAEVTNERDPLLSFCFGNRSAVLHEMERYDVSMLLCEHYIICTHTARGYFLLNACYVVGLSIRYRASMGSGVST